MPARLALNAGQERAQILPLHLVQHIFKHIQVANERIFVFVVPIDHPKVLQRLSKLSRVESWDVHVGAEVITQHGQAVVTFALQFAALEHANDLCRP